MLWKIEEYNSLDLDSAIYTAFLEAGDAANQQIQPSVSSSPLKRGKSAPKQGALRREADYPVVTVVQKSSNDDDLDALVMAFDVTDDSMRTMQLTDDAGTEHWTIQCRPLKHTFKNGAHKFVMETMDKIFTKTVQDTTSVNLAADSTNVPVVIGGNANTQPIFTFMPKGAKTGDYGYSEYLAIINPGSQNFIDSGFVFKTWNTHTLVLAGKMLSSGNDLRLEIDGKEVSRTLNGMDTASTKLIGNLNLLPGRQMTLSGSIAGSGPVTSITLKPADKAALTALPPSGKVLIKNGSNVEIFTYTSKDVTKLKLLGVQRQQRYTSMHAFVDGNAVYFLEHDIILKYGNATADTPVDDGKTPLMDASTSTQTAKTFNIFYTVDKLRSGAFKPTLVSTLGKSHSISNYYTGPQGVNADPATEMGMAIKSYLIGSTPKTETATETWIGYEPGGFTNVQVVGQKRRESTSWPIAKMEVSVDGKTWVTIWTETTPASSGNWLAMSTHNDALGATYYYIKFTFSGTVAAGSSNAAYFEIQTVTLTLDSAKVPQVMFDSGEQSHYPLNMTITLPSGKAITVALGMKMNQVLTVDCLQEIIYTDDGLEHGGAISWSDAREDWEDMPPGSYNVTVADTGTTNVDFSIARSDRRKI